MLSPIVKLQSLSETSKSSIMYYMPEGLSAHANVEKLQHVHKPCLKSTSVKMYLLSLDCAVSLFSFNSRWDTKTYITLTFIVTSNKNKQHNPFKKTTFTLCCCKYLVVPVFLFCMLLFPNHIPSLAEDDSCYSPAMGRNVLVVSQNEGFFIWFDQWLTWSGNESIIVYIMWNARDT